MYNVTLNDQKENTSSNQIIKIFEAILGWPILVKKSTSILAVIRGTFFFDFYLLMTIESSKLNAKWVLVKNLSPSKPKF